MVFVIKTHYPPHCNVCSISNGCVKKAVAGIIRQQIVTVIRTDRRGWARTIVIRSGYYQWASHDNWVVKEPTALPHIFADRADRRFVPQRSRRIRKPLCGICLKERQIPRCAGNTLKQSAVALRDWNRGSASSISDIACVDNPYVLEITIGNKICAIIIENDPPAATESRKAR